jgi:hypothetical protein
MEERAMIRTQSKIGRTVTIGAATALAVAGFVGLVQSPAQAAAATYTASPNSGPGIPIAGTLTGANTTVTLTGTGFRTAAGVNQVDSIVNKGVRIATVCPALRDTAEQAVNLEVPVADAPVVSITTASATKLVVKVKDISLTPTTLAKKDWKICVYTKATSKALLGSATFTVQPAPTVDTAGVGPAAGPTVGGQTIAIDGTGFTAASKVTIGGVAATGVKYIDSTSITAVTPAGTGTTLPVAVTTEGGKSNINITYDYINSVAVTPSTGPAAGGTTISVTGTGFEAAAYDFATNAAVIFTQVQYAALITNLGTCANVVVVSNAEIVCDTPALTVGPYSVSVVRDDTAIASAGVNVTTPPTTIASAGTFTAAKF